MAQDGDTITYTYTDGTSVAEDVSGVDEVIVDYLDGAGGGNGLHISGNDLTTGGSGGRVENARIDVSDTSTIYIWVASAGGFQVNGSGRYESNLQPPPGAGGGGGSTEISLSDTTKSDSDDEPFLVGAGGGGGGGGSASASAGVGGSRVGELPPAGGDGGGGGEDGLDGDGAIDDQNRGLVSGGTTVKGGGSPAETDGEIQLSFEASVESGTTTTYTYSDGTSVEENISTISEITIDYIDGAGGESNDSSVTGGDGGRVESVVADVSEYSNLYIWVGRDVGRYYNGTPPSSVPPISDVWSPGVSGASSEVSVSNTNYTDSATEPFIAAAGGAGGAGGSSGNGSGADGARQDGGELGQSPPLGGAGGAENSDGGDGEGAVSGHGSEVPILDSGTTITGGGTAGNTNGGVTAGEIQITYGSSGGGSLSPPDPPSNLNTEVQ